MNTETRTTHHNPVIVNAPQGQETDMSNAREPAPKGNGELSAIVGLFGGAGLGASVGGPIGAVIGGIIGAFAGYKAKGLD